MCQSEPGEGRGSRREETVPEKKTDNPQKPKQQHEQRYEGLKQHGVHRAVQGTVCF